MYMYYHDQSARTAPQVVCPPTHKHVASVVPAARSSKKGEENFGPSLLYYSDREHGNYSCLYAAADGMGDMALSLLPSRLDGSLLACDLEVELRGFRHACLILKIDFM